MILYCITKTNIINSIYFNIYSISKSIDMIHTFRTVITVLPPQDTVGFMHQMIRRMVLKYHSRATIIITLGHSNTWYTHLWQ